ncbi:MAG TPA: hypothetical protein VM364_15985 [Vicinamibacterales bacterium]|nr:hypothetical protein [Vicinamibacterales bacterium]
MSINGTNHLGVNLAFTKFIFVRPAADDDAALTRLRAAGGVVARGFFNDFEAEGGRDSPPHETIQFLVSDGPREREGLAGARYALQVSSKYRPRLQDTEAELRRRLSDNAEIVALDGAVRVPQYTSAEMYAYAYKNAVSRRSGRVQRNVVIIPIRKTEEWWAKSALDRHAYFYPHTDGDTGARVKGHARAAEPGIATIHRRLYYNPEGPGRPGEFDFITYFECADEHLGTFDGICRALRDREQNPEWRYVIEGPEWRGRRVLKW